MQRILFLLIGLMCFSTVLPARQEPPKIACYSIEEHNAPHKKKLWDGYEISLGPVANPEEVEGKCTAAIYNKAGRVVFRTGGFNVVFDEELTGEDFDGDGKPDVVFQTDTGGGNHCCWGYIIYSLSPKPHKLLEISMEGKVDFEKDKDGKMVIWQRVSAPGASNTSMAMRPFAEKILRVKDGKLLDATAEFCGRNDPRFERSDLTPEDLKKLEHAGEPRQDLEDIISALEARTAQHVYCQEFDAAVKDLNLWPAGQREAEIKSLLDALGEEYPEFAKKLLEPAVKK
ncbi:MAG TPA: hypothetical protein VJO16_08355 [Candidatus Acidoferrum sp.]|nr:hypothetical protein [Candidatus Acidoferrum sp.]